MSRSRLINPMKTLSANALPDIQFFLYNTTYLNCRTVETLQSYLPDQMSTLLPLDDTLSYHGDYRKVNQAFPEL